MTSRPGGVPLRRWLTLFLVAVAIAAVPTARALVEHDGDPTTLLRVGEHSAARGLVEEDFRDPVLVPDYGHDGQQFYVLAATFPDLRAAEGHVDKVRYRARRVLLPALVSPLPRGGPTVWGMLAVNLVAVGAAAVAVGQLARRLGASIWLGLSVSATPALLESVSGSLGDAPAFALAIWGVVVWRRRPWLAAALFLFAALSRETALVVPLACLVVARPGHRRPLLAPFAGYALWMACVAVWLPADPGSRTILQDAFAQFGWPFEGWAAAGWGLPAVLGVALVVMSLASAWVLRASLPEISWWLVFDTVALLISNDAVVFRAANFARVAPMAIPAMALALGAHLTTRDRTPTERPSPPVRR